MSTAEVTVSRITGTELVAVEARGGNRRERGAAIGAAVRGQGWERVSARYSETYGFLHATYARYRIPRVYRVSGPTGVHDFPTEERAQGFIRASTMGPLAHRPAQFGITVL